MKTLTCAVLLAITVAFAAASAQDRPLRPVPPAPPARPSAPQAPVAPVAPLAPLAPRAPEVGLRIDEGRQRWTFRTRSDWTTLRVDAIGRIELTDDERDVRSVSPNGSIEIVSKGWLSLFGQRYSVRGNTDGTVTRQFTVGGVERPIDADARAWIAGTIQQLVQQGFDAEARVARILAARGPAGVLDEISRLDSDFIKARYFALLFRPARLERPIAERALRQAAGEIGSDFELARVLMAFIETSPLDDAIAPVFVDATNAIGSDFEHARVLLALIASDKPAPVAVKAALASVPRIGSDFEKARVLGTLAQKQDIGAEAVISIVRATASIGSDFEQSRVLLQVLGSQPIDAATRQTLLETANGIGSDFERGRVMSAMLRSGALR